MGVGDFNFLPAFSSGMTLSEGVVVFFSLKGFYLHLSIKENNLIKKTNFY